MLLNGQVLQHVYGDIIPTLSPQSQASGADIELSPISFGFIVFKTANAKACM